MNDQLEIIFQEYNTIFSLRERCIKNIEESMKTYLIFLGFSITAFSFVVENVENVNILIGILLFCCVVGFLIYILMIETHINFINYTKKLNKTREYFMKWKGIQHYLQLPTTGDEPDFDEIGFNGKIFSRSGILRLIQILNSMIAVIFCYLFLVEIVQQNPTCQIEKNCIVFISIGVALIFFFAHTCINDQLISGAKNKWLMTNRKGK